MLKILLSSLAALLLIIIVIGVTTYDDKQFHPTKSITPITVNEILATKRLSQAIQIATVSNDDLSKFKPEPFKNFAQFLQLSFPLIDKNAERTLINDYSIIYKFEGTNPALKPILLMGHMDVVSVDEITLDNWTHPPFKGVIENNTIYGRGAIDDKSTVMSLMEAMELTLSQNKTLARTVYFAFGHDEEVGGKLGAQAVAAYFDKKDISFEFVLDEGGVILKKGMMPNIDKEIAIIGIAEKGFVNIRLVVEQDGGHSSTPPENTGPGILAQAIVKLENNPFPANLNFTNLTFEKIGYYADTSAQIAMANQWITGPLIESVLLANSKTAASIRTTTAVTMLSGSSKSNVLPTKSTAVVNFRVMPGETVDTVRNHVEQTIDDPRVSLEVFMANNPSSVSQTHTYGFSLLEQTLREFDNEILVAPYMVQGGTDSKYFYNLSDAIYRFMRVKVDNDLLSGMHGIDERIPVDDYIKGIQFFHELIRKSAVSAK
jgi:carboxypeptidase PM20D1